MKDKINLPTANILRHKAEEFLKNKSTSDENQYSDVDIIKLIQELDVYQIEIDLQNEELHNAMTKAKKEVEKYANLYDFAPSGYFTLSKKGEIKDLNLTGANLLGKERSYLLQNRFGLFVSDQTKPVFNTFLKKLFATKTKQTCEVSLTNSALYVDLSGIISDNEEQCLVAVHDIGQLKKAEIEIKNSEENLRQSRSLLDSILESQKDTIIFSIDRKYNYLSFNKAHVASMKLAYNAEIKMGMNILDCISSSEDRKTAKDNYDRAFRGESHSNIRMYGDFHKAYYESYFNPIVDSDDTIQGVTGLARNITQRIENEETIKISKEKYLTLFNANRDSLSIFIIDDDGKLENFIEINPATSTISGYTEQELLALNIGDIEIASDEQRKERLALLLNNGKIDFETIIKNKKGNLIDVEIESVLINYLNKPAVMNIARDITERKQIEQNSKKAQENLVTILEAIPDMLFEVDLEGKIYFYQGKREDLLVLPESEFLGKKFQDILPAEATNSCFEALHEASNKGWSTGKEYSLDLAQGTFWFEVSVSPIADGRIKNKHFILLARDITERKVAEEQLRLERERIKNILELVGSPIFLKDNDHRITYANSAFYKLFCLDESNVIGKTLVEDVPKNEMEHFLKIDRAVLDTGIPDSREEELTVQGVKHTIITRKNRFIDAFGNNMLVGSIYDITDRKKAEEALQKSQEKLRGVFDLANSGIMLTDLKGKYLLFNNWCYETLGYTRAEMNKLNRDDITHPKDKEASHKIYHELISGKIDRYQLEKRYLRKDKSFFWAEVSVSAIKNKNGKTVNAIAIINDITERKKIQDALQESEKRLRSIFDTANSGIVLTDLEGKFMHHNPWCEKILGYTTTEMQGLTVYDISHPDDVEKSKKALADIVNGKREKFEIEKRYQKKDGSVFWADVAVAGIKDKDNKIVSTMGIITDITERRNAQIAVLESKSRLIEAQTLAKVGNWETDLSFTNAQWSEECGKIFGFNSKKNIQPLEAFLAVVHPHDRKLVETTFVHSIKTDTVNNIEHRIITADGIQKTVEERWKILRDDHDRPYKAVGTSQDITDRKQAQQALKNEKRRLAVILIGTGAGTWEWNIQTGVTIFNEQWANIIGYTLSEIAPFTIETWRKYAHPDDLNYSDEILEKHFQGNLDYYECELRMKHKNGDWVWILDRGKINEWDSEGKPLLMSGTHLDITKRKQAEQKLIASEKLLNETQFIANIGSYSLDFDSGKWTSSSALERILGIDTYYDKTIEGLIKIIHPEWQTIMIDYFKNEIITKKTIFNKEYKIIKIDTLEERWVHGNGELICNQQGEVQQLIGSIQDITDRKKMELALIDSENFAKATFDALSSHIAILDGNGVVLSVNRAWNDFMKSNSPNGSKIKSTVGQNYLAICAAPDCDNDEDAQAMLDGIRSVMKREQKEFIHEYACHSPSELRWFNARVTNFPGNNDSRIVVAHEDITTRKLATISREKTLDLFQKITRRLPGVVYQFQLRPDGTSCFPYASDGIKEIYDVYPGEVKDDASKAFDIIHPDDLEGVIASIQKSAETMTPWNYEYRTKYADGSIRHLSGNSVPQKLEDGSVLWHGFITDSTERHETTESLRESEEKYRALVENSPDGVVIYIEDKIAFINNEGLRMVGLKTKEEIIGKSIFQFVHPDSLSSIIKKMEEVVLDEHLSETVEEKLIDVNGIPFDVELKAIPTIYAHQAGIQVIVHDITKRKQDELELNKINRVYALISQINNLILRSHNRQELFQEICNIAVDFGKFHMCWIGLLSDDGKISVEAVAGNEEGYFKKFNVSTKPDVPEGRGPTGIALRENRTAICNDIATDPQMNPWRKKALERGYSSVISIPINVRNKTIGVFNLYSNETNFFSSEEEISLLEKIILNIAFTLESILIEEDRKLTEEKIRQLSRAVEQSPVTILITNTEGTIEYVNPKFIETTGYSYEEVLGKNPQILKSGYTSSREYQELYKTIAAGHEWHGEFHNKRKDGTLFWESATISPILNAEGKITHYIAIKEDITQRKKAEKELIKSKERAEESDRLKLVFLANMSHEIRTPMNGILGFTELLKEPHLSGEEQQEYIGIIEKSGKRMLNIINDIISISRIESGQIEVSDTETNINEQLEFVQTFFKPEAKQKGIELTILKKLPAKDNFIKTDREKVYAVLTNLVKNALKFTNEGSIEFGCEKKGGYLEFFVKDTGLGISKSQKKIIFERFRQANETISRSHEGSGLGLSISKAYVEMLDGRIWVESKKAKGSTFYFTIPIQAEIIPEENSTVEQAPPPIIKRENKVKDLKVLIVEDDAISKLLITIAVKPYSKEIIKVSTGIEAIEACQNRPDIDLVMMDINMPEMGGYEATKRIREFKKDLVIIAQTANGMQTDRDDAIAAGCTDYISKPININSLGDLIQKYFGK